MRGQGAATEGNTKRVKINTGSRCPRITGGNVLKRVVEEHVEGSEVALRVEQTDRWHPAQS